jgi:hypothetical protein
MGFIPLFWGFLFMFDFRVNTFDILPDFIGYILFFIGLSKLAHLHEVFRKARPVSAILIIISLPSIVEFQVTGVFILFSVVHIALDLFMVYMICQGIQFIAHKHGDSLLERSAAKRWRLYWILQLAVILSYIGSLTVPSLIAGFIIPIFVFSILVLVLMMGLMRSSSKLPESDG